MAADIFLSTDRPWQSGTPERIAVARRAHSELGAHRLDRDGDDGAAGGRARGHHEGRRASRGAAGVSFLWPADAAGWPAVLPCAAAEQRRARAPGAARAVRPRRWRCHRDRQGAVRRSRGHCARARTLAQRVQPGPAGVHRLRRSCRDGAGRVRQPRRRARCCFAFPSRRSTTLTRELQAELRPAVRARALVSGSSGADRRRLRARGKLSQPRRPRHRRARRHRRVERHARVRAAEDQEHRGHEVRRRHEPPDSQRVSPSVPRARHHRQPHRRRAGVDRDRGDSRRHESDRHADGGLRIVVVCRRAGHWRRRARVAAVRDGAAARSAAGEAVAAAAA